ncbi:dNTP triphosphohydrolase [Pseudoflavonifractor sp. 524-17]|uniref:dGTP triphosphohydrolase n=1 Tax=Pseudoflavonifractor sp. 524-17 TaxID=2304577 RepID=UPI00137A0FEF|nr:dNTP triphosphohydrolase [Pseudoflavonifractor sp. 524-17]NCE64663.1 dNTP triphosphohydrolase [Pseudoflavonifractor sp. 524-17]
MNWRTLLGAKRQEEIDIPPDMAKYPTSEFEQDYWRIVNSAPFRRLQDKTQVFPLDKSDFVRTRLTHSVETSALAKQLTTMATANIIRYQKDTPYAITEEQAKEAANAAMCAGLLHDIGNPPFGHFGEVVIGAWFQENLGKLSYKGSALDQLFDTKMTNDLYHFEGNAQALRLLTKVYHVDGSCGMNLTPAVLHTLVKYPVDSSSFHPKDPDIKRHKPGYFQAEEEQFRQMARQCGTEMDGTVQRHPLTYILEAADDIAYATADLEDAYKKGLFTLDDFITFYWDTLAQNRERWALTPQQEEKSGDLIRRLEDLRREYGGMEAFQRWIAYARHWLMYTAAFGFTPYGSHKDNTYADIMEGRFQQEIISRTYHGGSIRILKAAMGEFVYQSPGILTLELAAQTILSSLLSRFAPAVIYMDADDGTSEEYRPTPSQRKLIRLLSDSQLACYQREKTGEPVRDLYLRMLLVTDFISGMTDSYAKNLYQELAGIY